MDIVLLLFAGKLLSAIITESFSTHGVIKEEGVLNVNMALYGESVGVGRPK